MMRSNGSPGKMQRPILNLAFMALVRNSIVKRQSGELEAIMRQLQRWYGCAVFYTSEEVKQQKFWGAVGRDMELRKVLDIIEETTNVRFDIKGTTVVVGKT